MASAPHTAGPAGADGSEVFQPAPVPEVTATATAAKSASTLAPVVRFWAQRPIATPTRFKPVKASTNPQPSSCALLSGQPHSRARYSPLATPTAAMAAQ